MRVYHILGVMSGSSLDALDCALVRFVIEDMAIAQWNLVNTTAVELPEEWKSQLAELPYANLDVFFQADVGFGKFIGAECKAFIEKCGVIPDAIVSHGHTILHNPADGYSVQIGHPAYIAMECGCQVISDLRSVDISAGGQGAPLAPAVERFLLPGYDFYLNLGGIANLSYIEPEGAVHGWDIAPANQLLNFLARKVGLQFDDRGVLARSGSIDDALIVQLKNVITLPREQPFSLDNSWIQRMYYPILENTLHPVADILATAIEFIALSVALQIDGQCDRRPGMQLMVTGGGAHNTFLVERIKHHIAPVSVVLPSEEIIDFKEAMLMTVCGLFRLLGRPNAFASVTGAAHDTINGIITAAQDTRR